VVSRETFRVPSFLIKRVFRLYPLWLVMLFVFAVTASLWRGLQPFETPGYFLYSATLLPTFDYPFYNVGWSLQPEIAFYIIVAAIVPLLGLRGLVAFLLASAIAAHLVDGPWYFVHIARYYGLFLAGVLACMAHDKLARFGFWRPAVTGVTLVVLLGYFSEDLDAVRIVLRHCRFCQSDAFREELVAQASHHARRCFLFDLPDPPDGIFHRVVASQQISQCASLGPRADTLRLHCCGHSPFPLELALFRDAYYPARQPDRIISMARTHRRAGDLILPEWPAAMGS
jgi:hypothetical protein